ncbi:MAG TPA: hypothetical protein PLH46_01065 [Caldisericia bacterium]|jgi:hypothetical protein|nr:hypothetical protein [Caldisericia bacterium]
MSNLNFSIDSSVKETTNKSLFPVRMHDKCFITSAGYNEEYDCLDIAIESDEYKYRERMFNPLKNVPTWTTSEKELATFQSRIKHFLKRFMTEEQASITADNFREMCEKAADLLQIYAIDTKQLITVKFVYDKAFKYPQLPKNPRFLAAEGEPALEYTNWEKSKQLLDTTSEPATADTEDIF